VSRGPLCFLTLGLLILAARLAASGALRGQEPAREPVEESAAQETTPAEPREEALQEPGAAEDEVAAAEDSAAADTEGVSAEAETPKLELPKRLALQIPKELRPEVEVVFVADAESRLLAGGVELGILPEGERRRVRLRSGDHWIKARSVRFPGALWDRVVSVREGETRVVEIKMLKAIRELHRHERQTRTYRAPKSDLVWARQDNGGDVRWEQAAAHCEQLALGGYEDWRLPAIDELRTIRALWSVATFKVLGGISLTGCCPWSADLAAEGKAWNFNFVHRRPFVGQVDNSFGGRALCVRIETEEDRLRDEASSEAAEAVGEEGAAGLAEGGEGFP
jgi:hypothetical protein